MTSTKEIQLVPNEGMAQVVDRVRITKHDHVSRVHPRRYEVTFHNGRGLRALVSEWRHFDTWGEAATYANDFVARNKRRVAS